MVMASPGLAGSSLGPGTSCQPMELLSLGVLGTPHQACSPQSAVVTGRQRTLPLASHQSTDWCQAHALPVSQTLFQLAAPSLMS